MADNTAELQEWKRPVRNYCTNKYIDFSGLDLKKKPTKKRWCKKTPNKVFIPSA